MGYSDERYTITKRKTPENHKRGEEMSGFGTLALGMLVAIALGQQAGIWLHPNPASQDFRYARCPKLRAADLNMKD